MGLVGSEGFATGLGGTATMVADVGAVIVLAFRTIHKIAMCYGYEVKSAEDKEFVLNILSVSGANDMKEKKEALLALKSDFLQKMNCQSKCDTSFKNKLNGLSQFKHFLGLLFNSINFFIKSSLDIFPKSVFFG